MPGGETIGRATQYRVPSIGELVKDWALRLVCAKFEHRWRDSGHLPYGKREWCERCESNRITLEDGEVFEATAMQVVAADVEFAEALYEARWGAPPRRKMRHGEWPAL